ncbi:MAG: porin family protein [Hyphomicrobiales bacterium]|nr:porin family protein [Hyphomicrobiales bacterium]
MKRAILAIATSIALSSAAFAADAVDTVPAAAPAPVAPAYDWTGFFIGIQGGYEWRDDDLQDTGFGPPPIGTTFDFDGAVLGIHAGYNQQYGNFVLGVIGDFEWADGSGVSGPFGPGADVFGRAEANWTGSVRARLGYTFNNWMVFATGGGAVGDFDFDYASPTPTFGVGDQFSDTMWGWTAGGGVAVMFNQNWSGFAEYRYTDYGSASSTIIVCCGVPPPNNQTHDITSNALRVGLSRKF